MISSTLTDTESTSNIMTCVGNRPVGAYMERNSDNSDRPITLASVNIIPNIKKYPKSSMLFATLNCRSVKNKALSICDFVTSHDLDILAITESWLGSDIDEGVIQDLVPSGYNIMHHSRNNRRGGGIALLFKGGIGIKRLNVHEKHFTHFEHMEFTTPSSKSNGLRNTVFFEEWESYLDQNTILVPTHNVLFTGDFNFHLDNLSDPDALRFHQSLEDRNLTQHVKDATHERGHILDLLITNKDSQILNGVPNVQRPNISDAQGNLVCDHFSVHATLACQKPKSMRKDISLRKCKEIDMTELKKDIVDSFSCSGIDSSVEQLVERYKDNLTNIFDKHAPVTIKSVILRPNTEWYSDDLKAANENKRKAKRKCWIRYWKWTSMLLFMPCLRGATVLFGTAAILPVLGFASSGITVGSWAATWMASFAGAVPADMMNNIICAVLLAVLMLTHPFCVGGVTLCIASCLAAVGGTALLGTTAILPAIGFASSGITAGSWAAAWMASFGGSVPAGGCFALFQSAGMTGATTKMVAAVTGSSASICAVICEC
ncbi:unnamed protein product [Mytilus edulis]|uniref:Endonuclease/exonuclease/phosphatase domain-containing protein n=1 Tax=Mytilus edulis TaxID=6550 RepID=A0A8S3SB65_MYTED|nr:unnamed protein product [Mytilus edulis]